MGEARSRTLNIVNLTDDITPASGVDGIRFTSVGGVTINSDTGPFAIIATGAGGDGIFVDAGNATVTVDHTGDIVAGGRGIFARNLNEDLSVSNAGNIQSVGRGIDAHTNGDLTIESTGDIATTGASAEGIFAYNYNGTIAIASTGDITTQGAGGYGIRSVGSLGATGIASLGNITTAGDYAMGIGTYSLQADVAIASTGNITTSGALAHGIFAFVRQGTGDVTIASTGNITTTGIGAAGIFVDVDGSGDMAIASFGNITTSGATADGIAAVTSGSVEIVNTGDISATANGIYAGGTAGNLVINIGTIEGCPCAGVLLVSNGNNRLYNYGSIIAEPARERHRERGCQQSSRKLRRRHRRCSFLRWHEPWDRDVQQPRRRTVQHRRCRHGGRRHQRWYAGPRRNGHRTDHGARRPLRAEHGRHLRRRRRRCCRRQTDRLRHGPARRQG